MSNHRLRITLLLCCLHFIGGCGSNRKGKTNLSDHSQNKIEEGDTTFVVEFYENGARKLDKYVLKEDSGFTHGPVHKYHRNGKLKLEGSYFHDLPHGEFKSFYKNGNLEYEFFYEMGNKDSIVKYYPKGGIKKSVDYVNDTIHGIEKTFSKDGRLIKTQTWDMGVLKSKSVLIEKGFPLNKSVFNHDKSDSFDTTPLPDSYYNQVDLFIRYFENEKNKGKKRVVSEYEEHDVRHGLYKTYYPNGNIRLKGGYYMGEKDGDWKYYNKEGNLEKVVIWDKGEKVKTKTEQD